MLAPTEPVFACIYGCTKAGKTTDALYSFPTALYIGKSSGLKPHRWIGYTRAPRNVEAERLSQMSDMIEALPQKADPARAFFPTIVVDDFSLQVEQELNSQEDAARSRSPSGKPVNGFEIWGNLRKQILRFRDVARRRGYHVWINAHESGEGEKNGIKRRIGPKLPGQLPEQFPAEVDLVARATLQSGERFGWNYTLRVGPDMPEAISGDRENIAFDRCPMNSAEILRAAGYAIPRLPDLTWMDGPVERLSELFQCEMLTASDLAPFRALVAQIMPKIEAKYRNGVDARLWQAWSAWLIRDAYDRAEIRLGHLQARTSPFARAKNSSF